MSATTTQRMNDLLRRAAGKLEPAPAAEDKPPTGTAGNGTASAAPSGRGMNRFIRQAALRPKG